MKKTKTARGFEIIKFNDLYDSSCSIQQSSLATDNAIWIGINDADPKIMASQANRFGVETSETTGWVKYPVPEEVSLNTRMHLNREQVKEILPHLIKFVETGEI